MGGSGLERTDDFQKICRSGTVATTFMKTLDFYFGNVYFAIRGKSIAGAILSICELDWSKLVM